jgi:hypothetical protein
MAVWTIVAPVVHSYDHESKGQAMLKLEPQAPTLIRVSVGAWGFSLPPKELRAIVNAACDLAEVKG